jgi:hypothetical protein
VGRGQTFAIHRLFSIATLRELLGQRKKPFQALVLIFGAHLQNLLKLFSALLSGSVTHQLTMPLERVNTKKIIY